MSLPIVLIAVAVFPASWAQFLGGGGCGCPPAPPPCPSLPSLSLPQPCLPQLPPISLPSLPQPCLPPLPQISIPQCPPPPPCPSLQLPQIQLPQLPTPCLPSLPAPSSCGCGRKKREAPVPVIRSEADALCNNNTIRKIILKNLTSDPAKSKAAIHSEVKARLGGNFVVFCTNSSTSFVADALNYCVDGSANQTCYVFQI